MSNSPTIDIPLCGNCKFFVAGGSCSLVDGQIDTEAICDLHDFGDPQPIGTPVAPRYNKAQVNYKMGFFAETTTADVAQKAIQMEHELMGRGISEEEAHRAVIAYFSQREPPYAMPWPGPVTGVDLAGRVDPLIVPDTGTPLTDFSGLPKDVQPFPTPNVSPYGIGSPYPSNPTPDPNSLGSVSNTYSVLNPPYPTASAVWNGLATDVNSQPSMHGEYGFNVAKAIPEWRYPVEQSQMYPVKIPDLIGGLKKGTCLFAFTFSWILDSLVSLPIDALHTAQGLSALPSALTSATHLSSLSGKIIHLYIFFISYLDAYFTLSSIIFSEICIFNGKTMISNTMSYITILIP